jgi:hypothetical protein
MQGGQPRSLACLIACLLAYAKNCVLRSASPRDRVATWSPMAIARMHRASRAVSRASNQIDYCASRLLPASCLNQQKQFSIIEATATRHGPRHVSEHACEIQRPKAPKPTNATRTARTVFPSSSPAILESRSIAHEMKHNRVAFVQQSRDGGNTAIFEVQY